MAEKMVTSMEIVKFFVGNAESAIGNRESAMGSRISSLTSLFSPSVFINPINSVNSINLVNLLTGQLVNFFRTFTLETNAPRGTL